VKAAEAGVHQSGNELVLRRFSVELHALNEGRRAISDTDNRDSHFSIPHNTPLTEDDEGLVDINQIDNSDI
jgi:hypothetical protein